MRAGAGARLPACRSAPKRDRLPFHKSGISDLANVTSDLDPLQHYADDALVLVDLSSRTRYVGRSCVLARTARGIQARAYHIEGPIGVMPVPMMMSPHVNWLYLFCAKALHGCSGLRLGLPLRDFRLAYLKKQ